MNITTLQTQNQCAVPHCTQPKATHSERCQNHETKSPPAKPQYSTLCTVEGCSRTHHSKGYCKSHHKQWTRKGATSPLPPPKLCKSATCQNTVHAKDYCKACYQRAKRTGEPNPKPPPPTQCKIKNCHNPHHSNGLCGKHNLRWKRHGTTKAQPKRQPKQCEHPGCSKQAVAKHYCNSHYKLHRRRNRITSTQTRNPITGNCKVIGCNNKDSAKGYCHKHYQQWKIHGEIIQRIQHAISQYCEFHDSIQKLGYQPENILHKKTNANAPCAAPKCKSHRKPQSAYCQQHHEERKKYGFPLLFTCKTCGRKVMTGAKWQYANPTNSTNVQCLKCEESKQYPNTPCQTPDCPHPAWASDLCKIHLEEARLNRSRNKTLQAQHQPINAPPGNYTRKGKVHL